MNLKPYTKYFTYLYALLFAFPVSANEPINCFLNTAASLPPETTIAEVSQACAKHSKTSKLPVRLMKERLTENNDFVITPHKQNYILPFTHNDRPNQSPYNNQVVYPGISDPVQHKEAKLQLSLKVPLTHRDILFDNDGLYFGFTLKSFWQVYNHKLSSPFRETNYRPEVFYQAPISSEYLGGTWFTRAGFEHESNGQSQLLSRSWNRIYLGLGFQKDNWALYIQPWYRLPEDAKEDDMDPLTPPPPKGDDNPDIEDYLGNYEVVGMFDWGRYILTSTLKYNFDTGHGSAETGLSFPMWGRLRGFVQYYEGYGESLIDYDHRVQRVGVGILLTDLI
jgi:phospholipase A1/A2